MSNGRFLDPLILQTYAKGEWVLMTDFRYQAIDGTIYTAPKYFITDLASTPWIVKPLLIGIEDRPCGVIHDFLYCQNILSRDVCDALYYEMILAINVGDRRAGLIHTGLHLGSARQYAACEEGMKVEDLAFELMPDTDRIAWKRQLAITHEVVEA